MYIGTDTAQHDIDATPLQSCNKKRGIIVQKNADIIKVHIYVSGYQQKREDLLCKKRKIRLMKNKMEIKIESVTILFILIQGVH